MKIEVEDGDGDVSLSQVWELVFFGADGSWQEVDDWVGGPDRG